MFGFELNNPPDIINNLFDVVFIWAGMIVLVIYPLYFYFSNLKKSTKDKKGGDLIAQTVIAAGLSIVGMFIWFLPEIVMWFGGILGWEYSPPNWDKYSFWLSSWRWVWVLILFAFFARRMGVEHGENRWLRSLVVFLTPIIVGWVLGEWIGFFLISLPMIVYYYAVLRDLALVIMPASDPDDQAEQKKRAHVFGSYTWGAQSPIYFMDEHAWKKYSPRIPGDITWEFSEFPLPWIGKFLQRPGMIWTRSHQIPAISGGSQFKRVENPGVSFTGKLERPDQVFDLRLQLRGRQIEVVSKDGVHFNAVYFVAFRVDNQNWPHDVYVPLLDIDHELQGMNKLTYTTGSFHFSHARVQKLLGTTSTSAVDGSPLLYWDQWVMNIVEDAIRSVISKKNLDEMWRIPKDTQFNNALNSIAVELRTRCEWVLRANGVLLVAARVVNFNFKTGMPSQEGKLDDISQQQLDFWLAEWNRKRDEKLKRAETHAEREQREAHAYAESMLLNAVVSGLRKAHELENATGDKKLSRQLIAMRFLAALEDIAHQQSSSEGQDELRRKMMSELRKEFKTWQENFFPEE